MSLVSNRIGQLVSRGLTGAYDRIAMWILKASGEHLGGGRAEARHCRG